MSRWLFPWSGSIKKRACRYLLQHYLGHFLQERLSLDQLGLDLYNGSGVIKEINLDVWAVNELLETLGAPLEIVDGFVSSIAVTIPWQALLTDHCTLEVSGLQITCRPKYRTSGGWDSQGWSSGMTSSMQLAEECLKDPPEASEEPPAQLEGLEMFAQTIETVLRRIKVTFIDTIVRIEHQPMDLETGVALEVHIKRLEYFDEAVRDPASQTAVPVDIHQPPAFLHKILQLSAVQLFYDSSGIVHGPPEEERPESATSEGEEGEEEQEEEEEDEEEEEEEEEGLSFQAEMNGTEALDGLRKYMAQMDQELMSTNVGQSFNVTNHNKPGLVNGSPHSPTSDGLHTEEADEEIQPLDVDLNLVTNLLESLSCQAGLAGPASNLLQSLGIHLPPNSDPS